MDSDQKRDRRLDIRVATAGLIVFGALGLAASAAGILFFVETLEAGLRRRSSPFWALAAPGVVALVFFALALGCYRIRRSLQRDLDAEAFGDPFE